MVNKGLKLSHVPLHQFLFSEWNDGRKNCRGPEDNLDIYQTFHVSRLRALHMLFWLPGPIWSPLSAEVAASHWSLNVSPSLRPSRSRTPLSQCIFCYYTTESPTFPTSSSYFNLFTSLLCFSFFFFLTLSPLKSHFLAMRGLACPFYSVSRYLVRAQQS